ncbi:Ser/Thr protein phosphatase family protein [Pelomyxa schiedti]|nr:Ser/Thr protein phosphatase family protein [Pelomyxa schiedti]
MPRRDADQRKQMPDVVKFDFPVVGLPEQLDGLTIAVLSDFHYVAPRSMPSAFQRLRNSCVSPALLRGAIEVVNQSNADICVLAGDFIEYDWDSAYVLASEFLSKINTPVIVAVLGNHDQRRRGSRPEVIKALQHANITVLDNEVIHPFGLGLDIVGIGDYLTTGDFRPHKALAGCVDGVPRIVITHNPDCAAELAEIASISLQISGHTHGGQICLPYIGPLLPLLKKLPLAIVQKHLNSVQHWEWCNGLKTVPRPHGGHNSLYVTRGLGTHPPMRLFCPPEVTLISLQRADEPQGLSASAPQTHLHDM